MNLNIDELGKLIADAQKHAAEMMAELSLQDQQKVNEIVKGVDKTNIKEMETYLNDQKNA